MCWPLYCSSLYYVNRSLLNTLCVIYPSGSLSWNVSWPMSFEVLKDPYLFWSSFFEGLFEWMFLVSNHMLSSSFSPCGFCFFLSNYLFIASFAISINFVASSQLLCNPIKKFSSFGNFICTVRFSFCIGILLLLANLFSCPANSWHSVSGIFQLLGWFIWSIYLFEDDML